MSRASQNDVAAAAAIATAGAAARNVFLSAESQTTVASVSAAHEDLGIIDKHGRLGWPRGNLNRRCGRARSVPCGLDSET